jgi:hypothetical protein
MPTTLLKPRPGAAGERRAVSEAVLPEPIYPACKKLGATLSEYQKSEQDLEEFRAKSSRAQADEDKMLGDSTLSEEEAAGRINEASGRKSLYASRITAFERKSNDLLTVLRTALGSAVAELTHAARTELERRREIITKRVTEALGGVHEPTFSSREIAAITRHSMLIVAVERLVPSHLFSAGSMSAADAVQSALAVLKNLERLTFEIGREI